MIITISSGLYAQSNPSYPAAEKGYKRVDMNLPKIDNQADYKIEVRFGLIIPLTECEEGSFFFKSDHLKTKYGIPNSTRFPYYILENSNADINTGKKSDCNSTIKTDTKILSGPGIFIEYQSSYPRPFYIPEGWTLEYRIWAASGYISLE